MVAQLRCWYHGTDGHAIVHCVTFQKIRDLKVKVVSFFFLFFKGTHVSRCFNKSNLWKIPPYESP